MDELLVIGIGAGNPADITVGAVEALARADVIFTLDRATTDLTRARDALVERYAPNARNVVVEEPRRDRAASAYAEAVHDWRAGRAATWQKAIDAHDGVGAFLVWGDPMLYDSTIAVLDQIGAEYTVIPGISSITALCAAHKIALNRVAGEVLITTGRRLREGGWPAGQTELAVMLDGKGAYRNVIDEPLEIYWGAYVGAEEQLLLSGRLSEVADRIDATIAEARERHGWIMDVYLLRATE
ncbi:MAG: precorrin-6A synthase (deacetylating) [Solirubrobacterales bacterium]|nr:precorrin-6A synthase (deacetylating) [Solirubrobacterales bacterium]